MSDWADYVFEPEYTLMPLDSVEAHVTQHGRLPGLPSSAEVAASGVSLADSQRLLLEKIEELTLHLIAMEKRVSDLEVENSQLRESD